ncbi:MAG: hypothetical protein LBT50_06550 [Prevotellaceae bacterium]|jgi:hypothetical protein|nr:hypothetical protein [Prevotellaceae bacterium]
MGINMQTTMAEIDRYLQEQIARRERAIIYNLGHVGEQCVNQARSVGSYTDRTGNLRSSTGYVIAVDGKIVRMSSFEAVKTGQEGSSDGRRFAGELVSRFPKGIVLIVVAGMKYAANVSARGKDVLDSAELLAERLVPQMMKKLQ